MVDNQKFSFMSGYNLRSSVHTNMSKIVQKQPDTIFREHTSSTEDNTEQLHEIQSAAGIPSSSSSASSSADMNQAANNQPAASNNPAAGNEQTAASQPAHAGQAGSAEHRPEVESQLEAMQRRLEATMLQIQQQQNPPQNPPRPRSGSPPSNNMLQPEYFYGLPQEDPTGWIDRFTAWAELARMSEDSQIANAMRLLLRGNAISWFSSLPNTIKQDKRALIQSFKDHFSKQPSWLLE